MSIYKMNTSQQMKFVKLYKDAVCLWSIRSIDYKNRHKRNMALDKISEQMDIEGFGRREVAQKIKNVRSAYCQELRKIEYSQISGGEVYQPKVPWFSIVHSFLESNVKVGDTDTKVKYHDSSNLETVQESTDEVFDSTTMSIVKIEKNFETTLEDDGVLAKRRRLQESPVPDREAMSSMEIIQTNLPEETEFDVWCRSLAMQLNNMETYRALELQMKIQSLVCTERINYEKEKYLKGNFRS